MACCDAIDGRATHGMAAYGLSVNTVPARAAAGGRAAIRNDYNRPPGRMPITRCTFGRSRVYSHALKDTVCGLPAPLSLMDNVAW